MRDQIQVPPKGYTLSANEVHLWRITLDSAALMIDGFFDLMTEAEKGQAARFRLTADCHRFTISRAMIRLLVGSLLGMAPGRLVVQHDDYGKPFVEQDVQPHA